MRKINFFKKIKEFGFKKGFEKRIQWFLKIKEKIKEKRIFQFFFENLKKKKRKAL